VLGPAEPDEAGQPLRRAGPGDDAEPQFRLAELRVLGRDPDVACQRQLAAAPERVAVDGRNRRAREALDGREERRVDRGQPLAPRARESSAARRASAAWSSCTVSRFSALRTSGRSIVRVAI
jgi:hypothetical protein